MSRRERVEFAGSDGQLLAGLLELPETAPKHFALLAHCFTCGKDIAASARIALSLVAQGFSVLRFDFTGLGNSSGDFENTNFSSNVDDVVKAADLLRRDFEAPQLLIGHSLGGTAVLAARAHIAEVQGVVTIGAPASPEHVIRHFHCDVETIEREGVAEVELAGRRFTIQRQFLEDVREVELGSTVGALRAALLLFHSPVDATVSISQAEQIYRMARHPKSFISLDSADHLLTRKEDAEYVAQVISSWASRYLR